MSRAIFVLLLVVACPAFCQEAGQAPAAANSASAQPAPVVQPSAGMSGSAPVLPPYKPLHVGGVVKPPSVLYMEDPTFSDEASAKHISGTVQIYLWVEKDGSPSHVRVVRGVGHGLDEKAVECVRKYRFKPATLNGEPVKVDLYVEVNFKVYKRDGTPY